MTWVFVILVVGGFCSHKEWPMATIICAGLLIFAFQQAVH